MSKDKRNLGLWGENVAAQYLARRGYTILDRNARTPYGEIDLVTQKQDVIVFVEVKTRSSSSFGYPEEAMTSAKKAHFLAAAQAYLQAHPELDGDWRLDVIAVRRYPIGNRPGIHHFENAVT
jgi:putative endonuclease